MILFQSEIYWWYFPWISYVVSVSNIHGNNPYEIWRLLAGKSVTHLPRKCIDYMAPTLSLYIHCRHFSLPTIFDFGDKYESVLELFTERMLGMVDETPLKNQALLQELMTKVGFVGLMTSS